MMPLRRKLGCAGALAALVLIVAVPEGAAAESAPEQRSVSGQALGPSFVPGEALVAFREGVRVERRRQIRRAAGLRRERALAPASVELVSVDGPMRRAMRDLRRRPAVRWVERNRTFTVDRVPDDPGFSQQWGLLNTGQAVAGVGGTAGADIDITDAWDVTTGSDEVTVAVIDSGVAHQHAELAPRIWANDGESASPNGSDDDGNGFVDDRHGWDFVDGDNDPRDPNGHGTHVAGILGAAGSNGFGIAGVNWDIRVMPVRVADVNGSATLADMVEGFAYAAANGADVANVSLSAAGGSQALRDAVAAAPQTLFVVSAGNDGSDNDAAPRTPCNIDEPNLICVAASDQDDALAGFSNFGATTVDLAAPGVRVLSSYPRGGAPIFSDDFEMPIAGRWETGALAPSTIDTWARTTEAARSPDHSLADSPGADYEPNTDSFALAPPIDLSGREDCVLEHHIRLRMSADPPNPQDLFAGGDFALVEHSADGSSWAGAAYWGETDGFLRRREDLRALDGSPAARFRFALLSDGDQLVDEGAHFDDVSVSCYTQAFALLGGTSMAAPHVAGVAALLRAHRPQVSVAELRAALLDGAEPRPDLLGKVATGGRLSAFRALAELASDPGAPANVSPPTVEGSGEAETMLRCHQGEWTRSGPYRFTWLRDAGDGFEEVEVGPGANQTGSTNPKRYRTKQAEIGAQVVCRVVRWNRHGIAAASDSTPVEVVPRTGPVPVNLEPPFIHHRTDETPVNQSQPGRMLVCSPGAWTLAGAYEYRWVRDGAEVEVGPAAGQTGSTNPRRYMTKISEVGSQLACRVVRTNANGHSAAAQSSPLTVIPPGW